MSIREFSEGRTPERRHEHRVEFLGEQDGDPERRLKSLFTSELEGHPAIHRAYLARVGFAPDAAPVVALCLVSADRDNSDIVARLGRIFSNIFASDVPLDIVFLSAEQEADLLRVCSAFFSKAR